MTSKGYENCVLIVKKLLAAKFGNVSDVYWVEFMIRKHVGGDKRTVEKYKGLLREFGFLTFHGEKVNLNLPLLQRELRGKRQLRLSVKKELTK